MLLLEAFDEAPAAEPDPGPPPAWSEGFAAGLAEGMVRGLAEAEAREAALGRDLAQALGDMAWSYAEARGEVLRSLQPLFRAVIDRLLPALAAESLGPWLAQGLAEAARDDSARPAAIAVHPSRVEAVRACLPQAAGFPARIEPDPALGPNAARLDVGGRETALDLDACAAALAEALSAIFDPPNLAAKARHG